MGHSKNYKQNKTQDSIEEPIRVLSPLNDVDPPCCNCGTA